jgi:hypothetical protein
VINEKSQELMINLARYLLPGSESQPPAVDLNISGPPLERALAVRPDLESVVTEILERFKESEECETANFVDSLSASDLRSLLTVLCGAYFLLPEVRKALGYSGQQALTPSRGGFGAEELVVSQMGKAKRYRTPPSMESVPSTMVDPIPE